MSIELVERPVDEYKNAKGAKKTEIWKRHKKQIIAQGLKDEGRIRQRDEYLNRNR